MKKCFYSILVLCIFIAMSCNNDKEEITPNSNVLIKSYSKDIVDEHGIMKGVWTDISLYYSNDIIFDKQQDIELLKKLYAIDNNGNKHYVSYCFSSSNGWLHYYIKPGKYFLCLIQKETGKYTHTTIIVEENKLIEFSKVFESSLPENEFESW